MQTLRLDLVDESLKKMQGAEIKLTFKHFIDYLQARASEEGTVKKDFFEYVLKKFKAEDALGDIIDIEDVAKYRNELTLLYSLIVPLMEEEKEAYWALSTPMTPAVFYGTEAFYRLLKDDVTGKMKCGLMHTGDAVLHQESKHRLVYSFILNKLYHFSLPLDSDMVHMLTDEHTGMTRYFKANIDTRFVEVFAKGPLPPVDIKTLQPQELQGHFDWSVMSTLLPLSMFRFEGFSIITIKDITSQQALDNIRSIILNRSDDESNGYYRKVIDSLQLLAETPDVMFDLLPALRVNGKPVFDDEACKQSLIVKTSLKHNPAEKDLSKWAERYLSEPRLLFYRNLRETDTSKNALLTGIKEEGIVSYALLPIFYNNKVAGVLEAYSTRDNILDEAVLSKMERASALLAQLLQKSIDAFESKMQAVIRERFTSLQPAVQWKFNEVAWHYLRDAEVTPQKAVVENIVFKEVFPLYGAIDIRNSTLERNAALQADLKLQLTSLTGTVSKIKEVFDIAIVDEMLYKTHKWLQGIEEKPMDEGQAPVRDFLDFEVKNFLDHFRQLDESIAPAIDRYYESINEDTGSAFENRRALERSIQTLNSSINQYLQLFKTNVQESYPCYFEKFRTDGVEFDMYIGQSISPGKPFNQLYLKNLRLWQLTSMAAITRITHALLPTLARPLQTTQLIFIHANSIDISFRNDERRFDVDGGYNIRYQIVKKRIDKVNVRYTNERLTQPNKIALVYFNNKEAEEYVEYIQYLQEKKLLMPGIEHLDLEELQGVAGLKALRVEVALEQA